MFRRRGKGTAIGMAMAMILACGAMAPVEAGEVPAIRIRLEAPSFWESFLSWLGVADDTRSRPVRGPKDDPAGETKSNSDEGSTINPDGSTKPR